MDRLGLASNALVTSEDVEKLPGEESLLAVSDSDKEDLVPKRRRKSKTKDLESDEGDASAVAISGKFVDLTSVLPPVPKKGQFDVSTIKKSVYFFS